MNGYAARRIKTVVCRCVVLLLIAVCLPYVQPEEFDPQNASFSIEKSEHFVVRYRCSKEVAYDVIKYAEGYYKQIEREFELTRYSDFWTWENRCEIVLFASQQEYQSATGQPEWSGGHVDYRNRRIYSFPWADGFTESLLPHELTHIMFREYVKDNPAVPLWIDEGIAQYVEQGTRLKKDLFLLDALNKGVHIPFKDMQAVYALTENDNELSVKLFYAQARSCIEFMIHYYGREQFAYFLSQLRAGKTVEDALRFSYPATIDSLEKFEEKWLDMMQ
ncbi:hypothetical protein KDK77_00240 [bacterium]|nr:hypothetical protein [bacterium]